MSAIVSVVSMTSCIFTNNTVTGPLAEGGAVFGDFLTRSCKLYIERK